MRSSPSASGSPPSTENSSAPSRTRTRSARYSSLRRRVYPFVENHNFYVEHWHHSIFWNKVRELGGVFEADGYFEDTEDIFFLHRYEVRQALFDMLTGWATTNPARNGYWSAEIAARKRIMEKLQHVGAASRPREATGGCNRGRDRDAVGDHHRDGRAVARRSGRRRSSGMGELRDSRRRRAWRRGLRESSPRWTS